MMEKKKEEQIKSSFKETILAAGAILWRKEPFSSDIAVIHRTRYGGEWCLPKGKAESGETLEKTAKREVTEETGCKAKIVRFATVTDYKVKGIKKQVFYWHMELIDESKQDKKDDEVDQIVWLPPEEAIKLLTHSDQRKLIRDLLMPKVKFAKRRWFMFYKSARYSRLAGSLLAYRKELENKKCAFEGSEQVQSCWMASAIKLLSDAERSLNLGEIDEAWKCFHAAQRLEIYSMNLDQVLAKATLIRNEAVKMGTWRQKTILELLEPDKMVPEQSSKPVVKPPSNILERVIQAAQVRDESYDNQAHKDELVKEHIKFLVIATLLEGMVFIILWLIIKQVNFYISQNTLTLIYCLLFGMLGAIFSAALKVQATSQSSRIPELLNARDITILRIFFGGISALILFIFINSQFVSGLFTIDASKGSSYTYSFYFIAFVAGFSERLVLKTIETITK